MQWFPPPRLAPRVLASGVALSLALAFAPASEARVEVTLDAATLNAFLVSVTPPSVNVQLPNGGSLAIELKNVHVDGFAPSAGSNGRGHVLASLKVAVPALGLEFPVEPRLSLDVVEEKGEKICVLRFEKMEVPLPLGGVDMSSFMPTYRVPAEAAWTLSLRQGDVRVKSRLVDTRMGAESIRLGFDVELTPERPPEKPRS